MSDTRALLAALERHLIMPNKPGPKGGAFLAEVQDPATGTRRADAVFLNFTQSRGPALDVYELKVTRADFERELADHTKAEAWWPYCTRFWIVSPNIAITPPEKIPPGWGLMTPKKKTSRLFQVHVEPAVREPRIDMDLLITLAKKLDLSTIHWRDRAERQERDLDTLRARAEQQPIPAQSARQDPRLHLLDQLEKVAGTKLGTWNNKFTADPDLFGRALRAALQDGRHRTFAAADARLVRDNVQRARDSLDRVLQDLDTSAAGLAALDQLHTESGATA